MKRYVDELMKRINELIKIYEIYTWKENDRFLIISFHDNMIAFNLVDKGETIDEIYLSFEEKERKLYKALCLRTFAIVLGNVMVYKDEVENDFVMYHNENRKPYFALLSNDKEIISLIDTIIDKQEEKSIRDNEIIKKSNNKVKKYLPNIPVLSAIDERISLTKESLRK